MFRDDIPQCPSCGDALDRAGTRLTCERCASTFLQEDELGELMNELSPDDERTFPERVFSNHLPGQTCPRCTTAMAHSWIDDTGFQRCAAHGVWIATKDLGQLLSAHASSHAHRNRDHSKLEALLVVPVLGLLVAIPLQAVLLPVIKRRRLRKYLARTTPKPKP